MCKQGTEWNVKGKNPKTISRTHLQPEAKLWNTFVKWNLMPTSHNQTIDHTRLVLIKAIITRYKYTVEKSGWTRKEYMRKMEIADAKPIQMVMPTPLASEQAEPSAPVGAQPSPAATPQATPATNPAPTPAATPATPDSRQLQFMEETKVFHTSFINFLCFQFPNVAAFFTAHPTTTQPTNFSTATQPKSTSKQSEGAGNTEKVNLSSDDENDIFDRHTSMEHHGSICPTPRMAYIPESSTAQKRKEPAHADGEVTPLPTATNIDTARRRAKTPAGRIMISDPSSSPEVAEQPPTNKQRRYHVMTADSDDDSSAGCKGAVLGLHHMVKKKLHFEERMIQGFRETMWAQLLSAPRSAWQKIEYLSRHLPRQAKKAQKGMRFNQHIFLSIPRLRVCLNKAEKTSRAGSQAHAHKVYLEYKFQSLEVQLY
ncbi:hypothetical protein V6N12_012816 [Hibiscus sabdariffa]|uniref:Uncharacterized protein n=1 Tax=Hibiscus sabdariffa TaxID=183260 RepID=A0ABR2EHU0_9ROSI